MQVLRTETQTLDTSGIHLIAYLRPMERIFQTQATGCPDSAYPGKGEVMLDMGMKT